MAYNPHFIRKQQDYKPTAKYKLVVYFKNKAHLPPAMQHNTFFSCHHQDKKGEDGLKALKKLVTGRFRGTYLTALIYNNQTGALLNKWVFNGTMDETRI